VKQKWDRTGLDVTYLLTQTARDPSLAVAFNYASLLLNNSYFLEGLVSSILGSDWRLLIVARQ
jgi:Fe-Mn family superoxide dismutase